MVFQAPGYGSYPMHIERIEPKRYLAYRWANRFPPQEPREGNATLVEFTSTTCARRPSGHGDDRGARRRRARRWPNRPAGSCWTPSPPTKAIAESGSDPTPAAGEHLPAAPPPDDCQGEGLR
jgi:hypothetical protein